MHSLEHRSVSGGCMLSRITGVLKFIVIGYMLTALLLFVLAWFTYKLGLENKAVVWSVVAVYVLATAIGGFLLARREHNRRLIWGVIYGVCYFVVLFIVARIVNLNGDTDVYGLVRTMISCVAGGALGGAISAYLVR